MRRFHAVPQGRAAAAASLMLGLTACGADHSKGADEPAPPVLELGPLDYSTDRDPCAQSDPLRRALFGDLHAHTMYSFDAGAYDTRVSAQEAYRFARGETIYLAPIDDDGVGTRPVQLERPLDFAAVTDHAEFLGEVFQCTGRGLPGFDSEVCREYRDPNENGALQFGFLLSDADAPTRFEELCGPDGDGCQDTARHRWRQLQIAAEEAYDRSESCEFTSFVAYEYTNTGAVSNQHRNIVFATADVPYLPTTYFEATPAQLWRKLADECLDAGGECDVMSIPHNSNLSNGRLFSVEFPKGATDAEKRERLELRARIEPVAEIFQHKGDSECRNGHAGTGAEDADPLCEFEKLRPPDANDCGDSVGAGGMRLAGCSHRLDFLRNVLQEGLAQQSRRGVNPFHFGFIGSTDTHNGAPGLVSSASFPGHIGIVDDTAEERLGNGNITHDGIINNPGGLAGVWAEENSRPAIFAALRRGETFATSGPRIEVRFFGGWDLGDACEATYEEMVGMADERGVPMGGDLPQPPNPDAAPSFLIHARADTRGAPLERLQIVKGWLDSDGNPHQRVIDIDRFADDAPEPNLATCEPSADGWAERCQVWTDPDFDPDELGFYYARVLEMPTCRWSFWQCQALPKGERPPHCSDDVVETVVQHRAWASPIWFTP